MKAFPPNRTQIRRYRLCLRLVLFSSGRREDVTLAMAGTVVPKRLRCDLRRAFGLLGLPSTIHESRAGQVWLTSSPFSDSSPLHRATEIRSSVRPAGEGALHAEDAMAPSRAAIDPVQTALLAGAVLAFLPTTARGHPHHDAADIDPNVVRTASQDFAYASYSKLTLRSARSR